MQSVVSRLEECTAKDELMEIASRLVDQREKLQRLLAVAPPDKCLLGVTFRQMSIVATKEELFRVQARQDLPVNRIGMQYSRVSEYLETHFQLLREDCIDPLRQGIRAYRSNCGSNSNSKDRAKPSASTQELRIYTRVRLAKIRCGEKGVEYDLTFHLPGIGNAAEQWESSKRLMFGSLLCISSDQFQTFFWGVVARRDVKELAKGQLAIRILGEVENRGDFTAELGSRPISTQEYVMVESTAAYFEAYYHVLKSLQREEMECVPFTPYLLHLEPKVNPPSYLLRRKGGDDYDFSSAFPDIHKKLGRSSIRVTQSDWPSGWADSLDIAQQKALKQGLTKELAIIQGPPGTGKTFLGLLLVRILLANLRRSSGHVSYRAVRRRVEDDVLENDDEEPDITGPILVICYTNHALDQFLEGIYEHGEKNLIRIGGRGKSEILKDCNLQNRLQNQRTEQEVLGSHHRFSGEGRAKKHSLESDIGECTALMQKEIVTCTLLDGVATPEQIKSLFSVTQMSDRASEEIVEYWLDETLCDSSELAHYLYSNPTEAHEWIPVRRNSRRPAQVPRTIANRAGPVDEDIDLHNFVDAPDLWLLNFPQRRKLHEYWLEEIRMTCRRELQGLTKEYEEACQNVRDVENEIQLSLLRKSKVVGMTTTAAARHHDVLKSLKPEIVIVEEAAEVLESHILACLHPSVKHLILIGDHLQLRPSVAVYRLATENRLDVSMFERLVRSGVEHVTLQEQRRMRPDISKLVRSLYPGSRDHHSVAQYESVSGVTQNVFFFDHTAEEDNSRDAASKVNLTEANLIVEFCLYLLQQGVYKPENIAILSMYAGQLQEIKIRLTKRCDRRCSVRPVGHSTQDPGADSEKQAEEKHHLPRVSSVDDYQGEESDIIILSLVRSNSLESSEGVGKIGFLKVANRICVALTRARKGLFIFGNASLLAERSTLWNHVTDSLRADRAIGTELELYCQNHRDTITRISKVEDFKQVEDGGCSLPCDRQLECGHACPRRCHPESHDLVVCPKPCLRQRDDCIHICSLRCHGAADCPPCQVFVTKQLLKCEHKQGMACSADVKDAVCRSFCPLSLECGHECRNLCGRQCTQLCTASVVKDLPCGHSAKMPCHQTPESFSCTKPCGALLQECQHPCGGSCGKCKQGTAHVVCQQKCGRTLLCGHLCEAGCSLTCPPCRKKCQKRCFHSRFSESCGNLCTPCRETCAWQCEHHRCDRPCHEVCTRPRCDLPCPKLIRKCGHPCIGLCGEPCPTKCRVCDPKTLDSIMLMTLEEYEESDRFVQLEDCKHLFEVSGLDTWMDAKEELEQSNGSMSIKLKECPECRTPIWRTHRYSNVVKKKHHQVEEVKKKINGHEMTRKGNLLLQSDDIMGALSAFRQALKQNSGLMDAHFGIGYAFFKQKENKKAVAHFSYIVERSSFATRLAKLVERAHRRGDVVAGVIEKMFGTTSSRAGDSVTIRAILQWASTLTRTREFTDAVELCEAVLERDTQNQLVTQVKERAKRGEVQLVVQAMAKDVGERGHWYTCPNGHYYTIGECGGATQVSKCPDCTPQWEGARIDFWQATRTPTLMGL